MGIGILKSNPAVDMTSVADEMETSSSHIRLSVHLNGTQFDDLKRPPPLGATAGKSVVLHVRSASPMPLAGASFTPNIPMRLAILEKARRNTLADLKRSLSDPDSHRVMWHDSLDVRITTRKPAELKKDIDDMIAAFGGLDAAILAFDGMNPYSLYHPVCGISACNMFKLLTEKSEAIDPTKLPRHDSAAFAAHLDRLDPTKNHVIMIDDKRLRHKYLIDLPASYGGPRRAYIMQSDLGDGALPPLKMEDWIGRRGNESVPLQDLKKLIGPQLAHEHPDEQRKLLASILEIDKDPTHIDLSKVHLDQSCTFASSEYDFDQFRHNAKYVASICKRSTMFRFNTRHVGL